MNNQPEGDSNQNKAQQSYTYYLKYPLVRAWRKFRAGWNWLISKPERLTAISTFLIFFAAIVTAAVGIAQWRALDRTDESIGHQVRLTRRQIEIAEQNMIATNRPFMTVDKLRIGQIGGGFRFTPVWSNAGPSPTVNLRLTLICKEGGADETSPFDLDALESAPQIRQSLPGHSKTAESSCTETADEIQAIHKVGQRLYVTALARYDDVWIEPKSGENFHHAARYCAIVQPVPRNGWEFVTSLCPRDNCHDGDCQNQ
jgi:hypothetical protein